MRLSCWLPTFTHDRPDFRLLSDRAQLAERLEFDGIYLLDHLLPIAAVHTSAWLDTIVGLGVLASATKHVTIGTACLIAGFRHPVILAKQLASVAVCAGPRVVLGAASGWYAPEYEALGYRVEERGGRTDETLEALRLLLTCDHVSYQGRYWAFRDVTIEPKLGEPIPVLIGGGSRLPVAGSEHDRQVMAPAVLRRITRWDGWVAPCAGEEDLTYRDLETVQASVRASGRPMDAFHRSHVQWTHVVETDDRERALREQIPRLRAFMGSHHSDRHFEDSYLLGSTDDIRDRVRRIREHGFDELIVGPVTHDATQLELIARVLGPVVAIRGSQHRS
jgi:alkanesulfonate monooxygenase SsuD/methylene tetrahydromethanopterin reductase-like flavin-dependent oxidoreductase (luciferase family)